MNIVTVYTKEEFVTLMLQNQDKKPVAWDTETTGLDWFKDSLICLTMSFDGKTGYYIPWEVVDKELLTEFFRDRYQIGANLKFDCHFLLKAGIPTVKVDSDVIQLGQTLNEMRRNGLKPQAYYYTLYGGYDSALDLFIEKYNPKDYSHIPMKILKDYATKDAIITFLVNEQQQKQLTQVDQKFLPYRGWWTCRDFYEKIKIPSVNTFIKMEQTGVYVDMKRWDKGSDEIMGKVIAIKTELREKLGLVLDEGDWGFGEAEESTAKDDLQSGKKLGEHLEKIGWECFGRAKAGYYLTGDDQLLRWINLGRSEAKLIQKLRSYLTMQKTFIGIKGNNDLGWRRYIREHDDKSLRIHPSYKSMMMNTMRNGCGDPNWQQLPSGALDADLFKKVISTPDDDEYYLVTIDYASFQIRLSAIDVRRDNDYISKLYKENPNVDLHTKTAYNVFVKGQKWKIGNEKREISEEEMLTEIKNGNKILKSYRQMAKGINFGCLFGISYKRFSGSNIETEWDEKRIDDFVKERNLRDSVDAMVEKHKDVSPKLWKYYAVAKFMIDNFFDTYPGLKYRIARNKVLGQTQGFIRSYHGGIRRVPLLQLNYDTAEEKSRWDDDPKEMAEYSNITANSTIQTDEVCIVMHKINSWKDDNSVIFGTVHDSIDIYVKKKNARETIKKLVNHFEANESWQKGLKVPVDVTVCDLRNADHYYKHGYEDWEKELPQ